MLVDPFIIYSQSSGGGKEVGSQDCTPVSMYSFKLISGFSF